MEVYQHCGGDSSHAKERVQYVSWRRLDVTSKRRSEHGYTCCTGNNADALTEEEGLIGTSAELNPDLRRLFERCCAA